MADKTNQGASTRHQPNPARFIAALLAPLAAGEEPVDTSAFRKSTLHALKIQWHARFDDVRAAEAVHTYHAIRLRQSGQGINNEVIEAVACRREIEAEMCLHPAPTATELRWKLRAVQRFNLDCPKIAAAIAADRARLGIG